MDRRCCIVSGRLVGQHQLDSTVSDEAMHHVHSVCVVVQILDQVSLAESHALLIALLVDQVVILLNQIESRLDRFAVARVLGGCFKLAKNNTDGDSDLREGD